MNLETEIAGLAPKKRAIIEFEEVEKQPKLIKGGQMKDYQVSQHRKSASWILRGFTDVLAQRAVFSRVDAQEWCVCSLYASFFD